MPSRSVSKKQERSRRWSWYEYQGGSAHVSRMRIWSSKSPRISIRRLERDEIRYFPRELCGFREYQKGGDPDCAQVSSWRQVRDLAALAKENFAGNAEFRERYGSWAGMERALSVAQTSSHARSTRRPGPGRVTFSTGSRRSFSPKASLIACSCCARRTRSRTGCCRSSGLLAGNSDLGDLLPPTAKVRLPRIINASETIVEGAICVENYHAILEGAVPQYARASKAKATCAVLNDEAHHVANESGARSRSGRSFCSTRSMASASSLEVRDVLCRRRLFRGRDPPILAAPGDRGKNFVKRL